MEYASDRVMTTIRRRRRAPIARGSSWPVATAAFLVGLALPQVVGAHEKPAEREVLVQLDEQGPVALVTVRVAGPRALVLARLHDVDGVAGLSEREGTQLALGLVNKAVRELTVSWSGERLVVDEVTSKLEIDVQGAGALTAMGLLSFAKVSPWVEQVAGRLEVALGARAAPVEAQIQGLGEWRVASVHSGTVSADGRALAHHLHLVPGESLWVELARGTARTSRTAATRDTQSR